MPQVECINLEIPADAWQGLCDFIDRVQDVSVQALSNGTERQALQTILGSSWGARSLLLDCRMVADDV